MNNLLLEYNNCTLCPRMCKKDRTKSFGFCTESDTMRYSWAGLHKGEEPPLVVKNGSGTIFFSGCSLGCPICQNIQISSSEKNDLSLKSINVDELSSLMLELQESGACNINLVTAEHFAPSIIISVKKAKEKGLRLPIVFNASGFITTHTIDLLFDYVDLWLWDTKTLSPNLAKRFFGSSLYPQAEQEALLYLSSKINSTDLDKQKGVIVRHLVIPGYIKESIDVIKNYSKKYKEKFYFSLMFQFIPPKNKSLYNFLKLTQEDVSVLENVLYDEGIENGFISDLSETEESWRPDFKKSLPFPINFADGI